MEQITLANAQRPCEAAGCRQSRCQGVAMSKSVAVAINVGNLGRADCQLRSRSSRQPDSEISVEFLTQNPCAKIRLSIWHLAPPGHRPRQNQKWVVKSDSQETYEKMTLFRDPPPFGLLPAARPNCVPFHIAANRVEVLVILDRKRLEPALIHMSALRHHHRTPHR